HSEIVTAYVPQAATLIDAADLGVAASTRGRRLAELARPDNTVVRLSSDDGLIFTNTTAEAAVCRKADVEVEIVPGVGLSASTAAYTGTALTTNRVRSVRFIEAGPQTHVDVSRHRNTTHVLTGTAAAHAQAIGAPPDDVPGPVRTRHRGGTADPRRRLPTPHHHPCAHRHRRRPRTGHRCPAGRRLGRGHEGAAGLGDLHDRADERGDHPEAGAFDDA